MKKIIVKNEKVIGIELNEGEIIHTKFVVSNADATTTFKELEVGVAGVPDPYRGETVKAWVVLKPGETATEAESRDFCNQNMAAFKVPSQVEFRNELPKTTVGKILRRELVRQHTEKSTSS